jgi:hypothetical protein
MAKLCTQQRDSLLLSGTRTADWVSVARDPLGLQLVKLWEPLQSAFTNPTFLLEVVFHFNITNAGRRK